MTTSPTDLDPSELGSDDLGSDGSFLRAVAQASERPLPVPEPDRVGTRLGKYRIEEKLGAGGMGVVYRARDETLRRPVALKVLKHRGDGDPEQRRRFVREARAASAVRHPNVAAVYEVGEDGDEAFIAMELVPGATLRERLEDGPVAIDEAVRLTLEIARALEAAHGVGIVHRDLKPDNVVIEPDGGVKVLDFGLARRVIPEGADGTKAETLTVDGRIAGTPGYMSPEQARGLAVDARSDIFSLGVVLFELLTGERPFTGSTRMDVLVATSRDAAPLVSSRRRQTPRHVSRVVAAMLEKDPALRPASVTEVIAALEAGPASPRAGVWAWGVVALAAAGGLAAFVASSSSANPAAAPSEIALPAAVPEPAAAPEPAKEPTPPRPAATSAEIVADLAPSSARPAASSVPSGVSPRRTATIPAASAGPSARQKLDPLGDQK